MMPKWFGSDVPAMIKKVQLRKKNAYDECVQFEN